MSIVGCTAKYGRVGEAWRGRALCVSRLACRSFGRHVGVRRILRSTNCHLGQGSNVHCPSCIHLSDGNHHVHNSGFVIAQGKLYYFRPPRRQGCGVVSFVGRRPRFFTRCAPKVSGSELMGLMYGHLLGRPVARHGAHMLSPRGRGDPFGTNSCR